MEIFCFYQSHSYVIQISDIYLDIWIKQCSWRELKCKPTLPSLSYIYGVLAHIITQLNITKVLPAKKVFNYFIQTIQVTN